MRPNGSRLAELSALLASRGVGCALITAPASLAALVGWPRQPEGYGPTLRPLLLARPHGAPQLIVHAAFGHYASTLDATIERRTFGSSPFADELPDVLATSRIEAALELSEQRIDAVELAGLAPAELLALQRASLASAALDEALARLRSRKTVGEIDALRALVEAHEVAADAAARACADGGSEVASLDRYRRLLADRGAVHGAGVVSGGTASQVLREPSPDATAPSGHARWDLACHRDGLWADSARTVVDARAPRDARNLYARMVDAHLEVLDLVRPGVAPAELLPATRRAWARRGLPGERLATAGHGIGHDLHDWPALTDAGPADAVLEAGHVLCVESACFVPGVGGFSLEDMVVLDPTRAYPITRLPHQEP